MEPGTVRCINQDKDNRCMPVTVHHHLVCRHRIEVEIYPATAEVYFADERYADPISTQVRFSATVYNAPDAGVIWSVTDINGGPGAGSIDATGLYRAPPKGSIPHGHTEIVIAAAAHDPMRRAYAYLVLVGLGPEPEPAPILEIYPKTAHVYYQLGANNDYIDDSNKMQQFRVLIRNTPLTDVLWHVETTGWIDGDGIYRAPSYGSSGVDITVSAHLAGDPGVKDEAKIILLNYSWPGITP